MADATRDNTPTLRQAYNLRTTFQLLHISESRGHALVRSGLIQTVRLGEASPRVTQREIDRILREGLPSETSRPKGGPAASSAA